MPTLTFSALRPAVLGTLMGRLADGLFRPLVGLISLSLVLLLPADAYEFMREPHDYILVHHLDVTQTYWQWQYLQGSFFGFVVAGLTLGLIIASYRRPQRYFLRMSCRVVVTLTIAVWVFNFHQWAMTGFDH